MTEQNQPPRFDLDTRASGVLLHVTSLPGPQGTGDLGAGARFFVDFLAHAKQRWWQMLPVNPTGMGYSPYSGVSSFAGNPLLISLRDLAEQGLLEERELPHEPSNTHVDYPAAMAHHETVLRVACSRYRERFGVAGDELQAFRARSAFWLSDYALFMALRMRSSDASWTSLAPALVRRDPAALAQARKDLADEVASYEIQQLLFDTQWRALRSYAAERGVGLIGDAPIFVAHDSADVWANQSAFRLDAQGAPTHVSGVPPDMFSDTGQRWGTPLYAWDELARLGYRFWIERVRTLMQRFDVIRLDHFIGFARYWEIPADEDTAIRGRWVDGPKDALFSCLRHALGSVPFIAEDLGSTSDEVRALRDRFALPGMRVLLFGFGDDPTNEHLPHNYVRRTVAYTGTHDNDTAVGWFDDPGGGESRRTPEQTAHDRRAAITYLAGPMASGLRNDTHWEMIRAVSASVADTVILPMQDVLGFGNDLRMNVPGRTDGNWAFRLTPESLSGALANTLAGYTWTYGRAPTPQAAP